MSEHGHDRHDTHAAAMGDGDMGWAFGITENAVMLLDDGTRLVIHEERVPSHI